MLTMDDYRKMSSSEIMELFFYRRSPFAIKTSKEFYVPVILDGEYKEVTERDIKRHLAGEHTIGAYNSREDETCKWACIDFDNHKYDLIAKEIAERKYTIELKSRTIKIETLYEPSEKKGTHVWFFFDSPVETSLAYYFVTEIIKANKLKVGRNSEIDIFPKKEELTGKKVSWMVRLPR